jgi:amino acid permease
MANHGDIELVHGVSECNKRGHEIAEEFIDEKGEAYVRRRSSVVNADVLTGQIYDTDYESTKRGLKSRHAQMIALGMLSHHFDR